MTAALVLVAGGAIDIAAMSWLARQTPEYRRELFRRAVRVIVWLYAAQAAFGFGVGLAVPLLFYFHIL